MSFTIPDESELEVSVYTSRAEQIGVNVLHYHVGAVAGDPDSENFIDGFSSRIATSYKNWCDTDSFFNGCKVRLLNQVIEPAPSYSTSGFGAGIGGAPLPRQLCALLRKVTNIAGPRGRGRVYVPFPAVDQLTDGILNEDGETLLTAIRTALFGGSTAPGFDITWITGNSVSVVPRLGTTLAIEDGVLNAVEYSLHLATQRRRSTFGRPNSLPSELA